MVSPENCIFKKDYSARIMTKINTEIRNFLENSTSPFNISEFNEVPMEAEEEEE